MITSMARSQSLKQPLVALVFTTAFISTFYFTATGINSPRLISYDQLPPDTEECADESVATQLPNMAGNIPLGAAILQQRDARDSSATHIASRKPVRMIRDPNAAFSAVAVDTAHNEVVMTDENLFNVLVYNRQTDTPPTSVSDPSRVIGGLNTKIEFQCGLYIDPGTAQIYAVNNDTAARLLILSRTA